MPPRHPGVNSVCWPWGDPRHQGMLTSRRFKTPWSADLQEIHDTKVYWHSGDPRHNRLLQSKSKTTSCYLCLLTFGRSYTKDSWPSEDQTPWSTDLQWIQNTMVCWPPHSVLTMSADLWETIHQPLQTFRSYTKDCWLSRDQTPRTTDLREIRHPGLLTFKSKTGFKQHLLVFRKPDTPPWCWWCPLTSTSSSQ